jgi:hypothetical protein
MCSTSKQLKCELVLLVFCDLAPGRAKPSTAMQHHTAVLLGLAYVLSMLAASSQRSPLFVCVQCLFSAFLAPCRAKPSTAMQHHPEPPLDELLWTVAAARIMFGPGMNIQAPPNLTPASAAAAAGASSSSSSGSSSGSSEVDASWRALLDAGINDWGEFEKML